MFGRDPEIKVEAAWSGPVLRPSALLSERRGPHIRLRADDGWRTFGRPVPTWSSMLAEVGDPDGAPELIALRESLRSWRFYDALRTDPDAPARRVSVGTRTPVLASDGADLAAAVQTIREQGDEARVDARARRGFPGARLTRRRAVGRARRCCCISRDCCVRWRRPSSPTARCGTCLDRRAAQRAPRRVPGAERARDEPAPRPAGAARRADRRRGDPVADRRGVARCAAGVGRSRRRARWCTSCEKPDGETVLRGQGLLDAPPWHWPKR